MHCLTFVLPCTFVATGCFGDTMTVPGSPDRAPRAAWDHPACATPSAEPGILNACGALDLGPVIVRASPESLRRPVRVTAAVIPTPALPDGFRPLGDTVDVTVDDEGALDAPLELSFTWDPTSLPPGTLPVG